MVLENVSGDVKAQSNLQSKGNRSMGGHKRIGILTSGGDCAGLNPVIRAVVRRAVGTYGWEVLGIRQATLGLMATPAQVMPLDPKQVEGWLTLGGTMLGTTNTGNPFAFPMPDGTLFDRSEEITQSYHQLGLSAIIGIGGDGSMAILRKLADLGNWNLVGIPKTIDNDVGVTERSIGFDTAVNIATEALDRLQFTAASHSRVMVLEVMGRDAGHIAISAGIAGGADIILIPEIPFSIDKIFTKLKEWQRRGKNHALIVTAEAAHPVGESSVTHMTTSGQCLLGGVGQYLADQICGQNIAESRVTVLGHIQRGGIPSPLDRLIASAFGVAAVDLIAQGKYDQMVTWQQRQVVSVPIEEAIAQYRSVELDGTLVRTARGLGIYLGD
jgi:ATP-dependent phosphofructokinase / diphosphate-dependent phosphofructokinase